jgi:periplasmic protein TonB
MRLAASFLAAVLVTLALFYFMQSMISLPRRLDTPRGPAGLTFVQLGRDTPAPAATPGGQVLPPPPVARSAPPPAPALTFAEPPVPAPPPVAAMPELPRIEPGGRPYLGAFTPPSREKRRPAPPAEVAVKRALRAKPPSPPKAAAAVSPYPTPSAMAGAGDGSGPGSGGEAGGSGAPAGAPAAGNSPGVAHGPGSEEVVALLKVAPEYPREAARSGLTGWVKIALTITAEGTVADPKVIGSNPRRVFERAALRAIRQWRFKPRTIAGKPVPRRAVQVIEFTLARG